MSLNVARVSDTFLLPNGTAVHGEYFTHLMYGLAGVDMFQFHQVEKDRISIRVVPTASSTQELDSAALSVVVERVQALDPNLRVALDIVEEITLSAAGKHRFTRSDVASGG